MFFLGKLYIESFIEDHSRDDFMIVRPNGEFMICVNESTSESLGLQEAKRYICKNGRILIVFNLKNSLYTSEEINSKAQIPILPFLD